MSYLVRLLVLSSATFFIGHLVVLAVILVIAPVAMRRARTMRPQRAARFLLTLRLLPCALPAIAVIALCVPSYLRFEPGVAEEQAGLLCASAAFLGAILLAVAITRTAGALIRTALFVHRAAGFEVRLDGGTVWVVKHHTGLALAGILTPRLLVSEDAMKFLSREQLTAALRHERAHQASRDNFKRLLLLLAPSLIPGLGALENAWVKCAEWAADDQAAEGDARRSLDLAAALVKIARLPAGVPLPPLMASLVEADEDFSERVDRLLAAAPLQKEESRGARILVWSAALALFTIALNSMQTVHRFLERLL